MKMKKKNNSEKKLNVKTVNQARGQKEYLRGEILSTEIAIFNWIVLEKYKQKECADRKI